MVAATRRPSIARHTPQSIWAPYSCLHDINSEPMASRNGSPPGDHDYRCVLTCPRVGGRSSLWQDTAVYHRRDQGLSGCTLDRPRTITTNRIACGLVGPWCTPITPTSVSDRLPHSDCGLNGRCMVLLDYATVEDTVAVLADVFSCRQSTRWFGQGVKGEREG